MTDLKMITYNSVALKDDKLFVNVARKVLGSMFDGCIAEAREAFQSAYNNESNELHRVNAARRAANLVILKSMMDYGVTNWREFVNSDKKPKRKVIDTHDSGVKPRAKKWNGPSILDMASESISKHRQNK